MFGLFKKKRAAGEEKKELAGKASVMFIQNQLDLADMKGNKAAASRVMSLFSLGYILGMRTCMHSRRVWMRWTVLTCLVIFGPSET